MHWLCSVVAAIWSSGRRVWTYGHAKTRSIFASGAALFSDGYANAVIGPVGTILRGYIYPDYFATETGLTYSSLISSMAFAGIIIGQLSMSCISHLPSPTTRLPGTKSGAAQRAVLTAGCSLRGCAMASETYIARSLIAQALAGYPTRLAASLACSCAP